MNHCSSNRCSSVVEAIAYHAASSPNRLCMADAHSSVTYEECFTRIYGLAAHLKDKYNVGLETSVAVECNQSVDYMISEFAVQLLGGIFIPVERNATPARKLDIIEDTEAVLFIGKNPLPVQNPPNSEAAHSVTPYSEARCREIPFFPINSASSLPCAAADIPEHDDISFPSSQQVSEILFSTGTTGKSKGIVLTHKNDMALAENVICGVKMKPDNVELIPMPLSHSHGLRRTYANLVNGSAAVFSDGVTLLKKVFTMMNDFGVTAMDLSPSMLSIIFKLSKDRLGEYASALDYIQLGSAPLPEEDKLHLGRILPDTRLYNFYGSTEAGCSCLLDFNSMSGRPSCIGKPAVNASFIVVDKDRNEIESSPENPGFLASAGDINMKGYFKDPQLTAEAMDSGYIYTSDLGYIDEDGYIYMLGRKDDVINYGGIKIAPEDIESIASQYELIGDCACVPVSDTLTGQAPKLFIVLTAGAATEADKTFDMKAFKNFLKANLDADKQPKYIEITDEIPRTSNGKIKRNLLRQL